MKNAVKVGTRKEVLQGALVSEIALFRSGSHHFITTQPQSFAQMLPKKARGTRDKNTHLVNPPD
jgi:hypothetical protein